MDQATTGAKDGLNRDFLLKVGRSQPWAPAAVFVPAVALTWLALAHFGAIHLAWGAKAGLLLLGLVGWTLEEYVLHRFSFHTKGLNRKSLNPIHWINALSSGIHGIHHENPKRGDLVVAPPLTSFLTATLYWFIGYGISGSAEGTTLFMTGLLSGYLWYEFVHYSTHQRRPMTGVGRYLTKYHMHHHFTDPGNYFGVTSPIWDIVFGTRPKKLSMPRKSAA
jgi:sterol desaturase/sphingolipid hydroxylase (fatty acid hydroxylase superfamily)